MSASMQESALQNQQAAEMIFKDDWHIHSTYSCDGACMNFDDLVKGTEEKGILRYGVTDHIHTPFNYPDIEDSRKSYELHRKDGFFFGIEVSCVSQWELDTIEKGKYSGDITYGIREGGTPGGKLSVAIDEEFIERYSIDYTVGGTHWAMYTGNSTTKIIYDYHRQNMFLARHPLIDIVAHPWWYLGPCTEGWTKDFGMIPKSMHNEFFDVCISNGKLFEVNLAAILLNRKYTESFRKQYIEYLVMAREAGVGFSIGSDCHNRYYDLDLEKCSDILENAGFGEADFLSPV